MHILRACGVDGCKSGWFFFEIMDNHFEYGVCTTFYDLLNRVPNSKNVFVDIPIGLPTANKNPRLCDVEARKMLGPRRSSVFPAPIREVLSSQSYEKANLKTKRLTGKGCRGDKFYPLWQTEQSVEFCGKTEINIKQLVCYCIHGEKFH